MGRLMAFVVRLLAILGLTALFLPRKTEVPETNPEERAAALRQRSTVVGRDGQGYVPAPLPPGWSSPKPESTPEPTYWPFVLALGITFFAWGLISNLFLIFGGLLLFVIAAIGWIGDLLHEFA